MWDPNFWWKWVGSVGWLWQTLIVVLFYYWYSWQTILQILCWSHHSHHYSLDFSWVRCALNSSINRVKSNSCTECSIYSGILGTVHATQYQQRTSDVLVVWWCCGNSSWSSWHDSKVGGTFYLLCICCLCEHRTVVPCAEQRAFIIEWHFHMLSFKQVVDWFAVNFPKSPMPSKSSIKRVVNHFRLSWYFGAKRMVLHQRCWKMCPRTFWNELPYVEMKEGDIFKIYCQVYKQFHNVSFVIVVCVSVLHRGFQNKWNTL